MNKTGKTVAKVIAIVLAFGMIASAFLAFAPRLFAEDGGDTKKERELTEEEKKLKEEYEIEEYYRLKRIDELVAEMERLVREYKGKPGYYDAVNKLNAFLNTFDRREYYDPRDLEEMIDAFRINKDEMKKNPIMTGNEQNLFNPTGQLTRAEFAVIMARLLKVSLIGGETWYDVAMKTVKEHGYMTGDENGDMMPNKIISLAEVVSVLVRFNEFMKVDGDVYGIGADHWAVGYIQRAYVEGWFDKLQDVKNINRPVQRQEIAALLTKARRINIDEKKIIERSALYRVFSDVDLSNPYYYDILVNSN